MELMTIIKRDAMHGLYARELTLSPRNEKNTILTDNFFLDVSLPPNTTLTYYRPRKRNIRERRSVKGTKIIKELYGLARAEIVAKFERLSDGRGERSRTERKAVSMARTRQTTPLSSFHVPWPWPSRIDNANDKCKKRIPG